MFGRDQVGDKGAVVFEVGEGVTGRMHGVEDVIGGGRDGGRNRISKEKTVGFVVASNGESSVGFGGKFWFGLVWPEGRMGQQK